MHEQGGNGGKGGNPTLIFKIGYQYDLIFGGTAKIESTGRPQSALERIKKERKNKLAHNICLPTFGLSLGHRQQKLEK